MGERPLSSVVREKNGRFSVGVYPSPSETVFIHGEMRQRQFPHGRCLGALGRVYPGSPPKDLELHPGVPHESVLAVKPSRHLARGEKSWHIGLGLFVYDDATILVMEGWKNKDGVLNHVDTLPVELAEHGGEGGFNGSFAVDQINHGSVQPSASHPGWCHDPLVQFVALPNYC